MLHDRRWKVLPGKMAEDLAVSLTEFTWLRCCGFELGGYLWLNHTASIGDAQKYAVVRMPDERSSEFLQVAFVTLEGGDYQKLLDTIRRIHSYDRQLKVDSDSVIVAHTLADIYEAFSESEYLKAFVVHPRIETSAEHGRCELCR